MLHCRMQATIASDTRLVEAGKTYKILGKRRNAIMAHSLKKHRKRLPRRRLSLRQRIFRAAPQILGGVFVLGVGAFFVMKIPFGSSNDATASVAPRTRVVADVQQPVPTKKQIPRIPKSPLSKEQKRRNRLMDRLVAAYPDFLVGYEKNDLIWRDGTRMPFDDGREKTFEIRLAQADIEDQFAVRYFPGPMLMAPKLNADPGRFRNDTFFKKMYGDCHRGEVTRKLVEVIWLPKHDGKKIKITSVNGVAEKLQAVSNELDKLPPKFIKYLMPIGGTYNCRNISGTNRASPHSYGIAIDINTKFADYWRWSHQKKSKKKKAGLNVYKYRNRIPWEIAEIFEKHGFIWGGKWYHYDTLHFEYRPELLAQNPASLKRGDTPVPLPEKQVRNLR
jgi:hypothetical protein